MNIYKKIKYMSEGKPKSVFLKNPRISSRGSVIAGIEVNREGNEVVPKNADERVRVISSALIIKESQVFIDKKYGILMCQEDLSQD